MDAAAREAATAWSRGALDESSARAALAELIEPSDVAWSVAWELPVRDGNAQLQFDVCAALEDLLLAKVVGTPDSEPTFRLDMIAAGSSFTGGMRQLSRRAAPGKMRDAHARARRQTPASDAMMLQLAGGRRGPHSGMQDEPRQGIPGITAVMSPVQGLLSGPVQRGLTGPDAVDPDRELDEDVLEAFQERSRSASASDRVLAEGQALARMLRVPDPDRNVFTSPTERARLRDWLRSDGGEDVVCEVAEDLLAGRPAGRGRARLVARMFAGYSGEDLETLLARPSCVAHRLALAAASPMPPPQRKHVRAVTASASKLLGGAPRVAAGLVRAWADSITELDGSEYSHRGEKRVGTLLPKADEQMAADLDRFIERAGQVIASGREGLGGDPDMVAQTLEGLLACARSGEEPARRAA